LRRHRLYLIEALLLICLAVSGGCVDLLVDSIKQGVSDAISDAVAAAVSEVLPAAGDDN
jgi:hypothetical protein